MPRHPEPSPVPSATNLPLARKHDQNIRMRNYLIAMGIRTLAFILAFLLDGPARWVCVVLAVILPEIAVIGANAANQKRVQVMGRRSPVDWVRHINAPRRSTDSSHTKS
ncbi:DUF3099 domain-containing protein [Rudaeicoccus suwonensis]|uniref:DUF3099 family protein n=1 Tax=Rudaeicoccus suwonensis TaxID=657409 RepID=A0A561EAS5_9MICO|nr:DUF3099 domain-containing protein [Rudaeicoccus suwonensis]TWE12709.1 DUF3099 family protein [Rudaeicoccus suwonensis]